MKQVPNIAGALLLIFFLVFPLVDQGGNYDYVMHVLITAFFYAILASSWSMLAGYAGQFSFGHMAFVGIGAYTTALFCHYFYVTSAPDRAVHGGAVLRPLAGGGERDRRDVDDADAGQQKLLELGRLLMLDPDVIILDEPFDDLEKAFWVA